VAGGDGVHAASVGSVRAEGESGDEPGDAGGVQAEVAVGVLEESQNGRRPVERAVAAEEAAVGDDAPPGLAGEGSALEDQIIDQLRRWRAVPPSGRGSRHRWARRRVDPAAAAAAARAGDYSVFTTCSRGFDK
jgi:hypothetical protein